MPRRLAALVVVVLMLLAAACGSDDEGPKLGAAEPARAPATMEPPAGTVEKVGAAPQGIVYDAKTNLLAVAVRKPYRLLVVDPQTFAVQRSVPVPGKVRHLQLAAPGGPVLVPSETANRIIEVPLPDGEDRSTRVQRHPHDATGTADGDVLVGNEFSGSMSVVRDGKVVKTFDDLQQPGGVVSTGDLAAVVDVGDFSVTTYDLAAMRRVARVPAGEGPTHGVLIGDDRLAVTDTRGNQVLVYSLDPLKQVGRLELPGSPYGITSEGVSVWVTLTGRNELVGLDVSGPTPREIARYPTVRQPDTVAVSPGSRTLWVTGTADGVVQRIER